MSKEAVEAVRIAALEEVAKWHDKQARMCREVASDDPRLSEETRKRAYIIASHHAANATYIRTTMMQQPRIRAAKETGDAKGIVKADTLPTPPEQER